MAEHAEGDNIFLYTGQQEVPADVTHVIIDRSVKIVPRKAFQNCENLVSVESHNGVEVIKEYAFDGCESLREIKLTGVKEVGYYAFYNCASMTDVEFGNKLETIGSHAFDECTSLRKIKIPAVKCIHDHAFMYCEQLMDLELPGDLEIIEEYAFAFCPSLQRIAIPLKGNIIPFPAVSTWPSYRQQRYTQFHDCEKLTTVDLVGVEGIHKTISSLLLESWRDEMNQEIDRINQDLPNTPADEKTDSIRLWIRSFLARIGYYKAEHNRLLKEHMIQLELAVWKAKLDDFRAHSLEAQPTKKAKIDAESMRNERRITSGADIIIKNVLPFLSLE